MFSDENLFVSSIGTLVSSERGSDSNLRLTSSYIFLSIFLSKRSFSFLLYFWDFWRISGIVATYASKRGEESVVPSGDGVMFSLELDRFFVEGDTTRNKVDGIVDCEWIPRSCWKFLWFVDNWLVKRVEHLMRVLHWWSCLLADIISTIPRHLVILLMYNFNSVSWKFFSWSVWS